MKCTLYDITGSDVIGLGSPKRIERSLRSAYYNAYRMVRKAYNRNKMLQLLIVGENDFSMTISSYSTFGVLICISDKTLWAKEVI